ncbi:MAG: purine-binding chemotaxis protein CheW [Clostridiaceae bacterium]|jgi:purine-binding chemotaxis protein CheW|nr:purine-binding chemotaxis protein CheW [Clostridiaceae bacterium]
MADQNTTDARRYLVFRLENDEYGIEIDKISTIIEKDMDITRVPKQPAFVKGVINLRGEIIPVLSLRLKFGLDDDVYNEDTRIIIIKVDDLSIGLIVDSVAEVVLLDDETTESVSNIAGERPLEYLKGVGKPDGRIITLLDLEKIVMPEEAAT